jgi:hypothetical protein
MRCLMTAPKTWNGEPSITLYDRLGYSRLVLEVQDDLPRVTFYAPSGQPIGGLVAKADGGMLFALSRDNGRRGFELHVSPGVDAEMNLFDKDGQPIGKDIEGSDNRPRSG